MTLSTTTIYLENFQGPLDVLLQLVEKCDIDIYEIRLQKIADQFSEFLKPPFAIETGAEFIITLAILLQLKSKCLLPKDERPKRLSSEELYFDVIREFIENNHLKDATRTLVCLENNQKDFFSRGVTEFATRPRPLGIEHLTLNDLASLFKEIASKSSRQKGLIEEETWKVSDKISEVRQILRESPSKRIIFQELFSLEKPRIELIVTFLAVLELMKLGEVRIIRDHSINTVFVCSKNN